MDNGNEVEKNTLKIRLANAGFRSENAAAVYQGIREFAWSCSSFPPFSSSCSKTASP